MQEKTLPPYPRLRSPSGGVQLPGGAGCRAGRPRPRYRGKRRHVGNSRRHQARPVRAPNIPFLVLVVVVFAGLFAVARGRVPIGFPACSSLAVLGNRPATLPCTLPRLSSVGPQTTFFCLERTRFRRGRGSFPFLPFRFLRAYPVLRLTLPVRSTYV